MCGRFVIDIPKPVFQQRFKVDQLEIELQPHYNVCPGMFLPVLIKQPQNTAMLMKWGLVPSWSRDMNVKFFNINARAETITTSAAYKRPFATKRCLIPATGFYEWNVLPDKTKQPYYFHTKKDVFSFAGIWDVWVDVEGKEFPTCAIITCAANSVVGKIHPRMPVILGELDENTWLSQDSEIDVLKHLLVPCPDSQISCHRVSKDVNNPRNDSKNLIHPSV